jgi:hypothetical protein
VKALHRELSPLSYLLRLPLKDVAKQRQIPVL